MRIKIVTITPEIAREMLATQRRNRTLRASLVDKFVKLLEEDKFETTHQGIAFDKNGCLIDGQHRLQAIIKSGISADILVAKDLDENLYFAIDGSSGRRIADLLMPGEKGAKELCEMATATLRIARVSSRRADPIMVERVLYFRGEEFKAVLKHCNSKTRGASIAGIRVAAAVMFSEVGQYALDCYSNLVAMKTESFQPVMHAFNRWVVKPRMNDDKDHEKDMFARAMIAFHPSNKMQTKIQIKKDKETGKPDYFSFQEQLYSWAFKVGLV